MLHEKKIWILFKILTYSICNETSLELWPYHKYCKRMSTINMNLQTYAGSVNKYGPHFSGPCNLSNQWSFERLLGQV